MARLGTLLLSGLPLMCAAVTFAADPIVLEAEHAILIGRTHIAHENPDGTGRAWVTGFVQPGDALDFTINVPAASDYRLEFTYSADGDKHIPVTVGDNLLGSRRLPKTDGFETRPYGRVPLVAGDNRLRIGTDWGHADIDAIRLSPAAPAPFFDLATGPVNPNASPEARALFTRLTREFGRRTFAGQHEADVRNPTRLDQVAHLAGGAAPAILGLDLQLYSQVWTNPEPTGATELALDWARRGGIVTLSWHWLSPFGARGEPVWDTFYTNRTTFDASRIADQTSPEHAAIMLDLDRIAVQLARLRDARVPVLWRPLHEAEGGWFWWGARGPETAKTLYRLMFERFTSHHRLDNLIWVWTTTDNDDATAWYPGYEYVDVLAADLYAPAGSRGDFSAVFDRIRELHQGRKPIALGECGALPLLTDRAPWLWLLVWDDHIVRHEVNAPADVARLYRSPRVVTLPPDSP
ncbi:MAG: glycosyl hydrolase [Verrucomicrobiota bacterium]